MLQNAYFLAKIGADTAAVSYTHLRAHETDSYLVCRLLLEKNRFDTADHEPAKNL